MRVYHQDNFVFKLNLRTSQNALWWTEKLFPVTLNPVDR
jgi:hypothetical protein